jgi:two-component system response regulator PilR (NtrC family)
VDLTVLRRLVSNALELGEQRKVTQTAGIRLVGDSARMQQLRATIAKLARSQAPVYIAGESGVGKELVARLIHEQGARSSGPFVPVNCGAIPSELMESELFGHKKGSFTGAHADKDGLFQTANGGTLFLDEVAELPLHLQVKLLRVIQEKNVRPVGASAEVPLDVRILSATHKNLQRLVDEGKFRHDLYYRINVIELPVPPLRERREDILPIAEAILARLAGELGEKLPPLSEAARDALQDYAFPGNVRELENILERAVALCDGSHIEVSDLRLPRIVADAAPTGPGASAPSPARAFDGGLPDALEQIERETIQKALEACRYNKTKAAAQLGITFRALRYKLKKLEME